VLAERALEFVHADVLLGHVRLDDLAVMHEETGLSLDVFSKTTVATGKLGDQIIKDQQSRGGDGATGERGVGAGHGVLHRVRNQQEQREIEGGHLADFTLAADADSDKHEEVDDSGAERDLEERVQVCGQHGKSEVRGQIAEVKPQDRRPPCVR
jgi:hypothetical protein